MENYYVQGTLLDGKKAVIAVALPAPSKNNAYLIYDIYNISDSKNNKIVIQFKDFFGDPLLAKGNLESFIIDLSLDKFKSIDFTKKIYVAFHHENDKLTKTLEEIYNGVYHPIVLPDTTGKGTIRESE